jgi:hypothetical protein
MPIDIEERRKKELKKAEEKERIFEHFHKVTLPNIHKFLKQNQKYEYSLEEIEKLFPDSKGMLLYYYIVKLPGVYHFDGEFYMESSGYSYRPSLDPETEEFKKLHPMTSKKKCFWDRLLE